MEYIGIVFGIFGLLAYIELFSLKKRVVALEEELAGIAGTASYEERRSLLDAVSGDFWLSEIEKCTFEDVTAPCNQK